MLKAGLNPTEEEWGWVNRYLALAERVYPEAKDVAEAETQAKPLAEPETEKAS